MAIPRGFWPTRMRTMPLAWPAPAGAWIVGVPASSRSTLTMKFEADATAQPTSLPCSNAIAHGTPTIHAPAGAGQASGIVRILVGQNPRGIAIDSHDAHAYVANEVSRDVSVVDLASQAVVATIRSSDLPVAGTDE